MTEADRSYTTIEAVGVFHDHDRMVEAVDALMSSGFDRSQFSVLAGGKTVERKLGHRYRKVAELEDNPNVPRKAYVAEESIGDAEGALIGGFLYVGATAATGAVVATGGALAAVIAAAAVAGGIGALIGGVLATLIAENHAIYLQEQLDNGGFLLWVRLRDTDQETKATEILRRHSGEDVHVHEIAVS
jgi:outer membrane lipoprotein SlyB